MDRRGVTGGGLAAVLAGLLLLSPSASAESAVTIEFPADGATISQQETPEIRYLGTFDIISPAPITRTLYPRREACSGDAFLSDTDGPDGGNGCETPVPFLLTVLPDEDDYSHTFTSNADDVDFPITLDASRNITGQINIRANTDTPNWHDFAVEVKLGDEVLPRQRFDDGIPQSTSFRTLELDIDVPDQLDKTDIDDVVLTVYYQRTVLSWIELDNPASFIELPAYSHSFEQVQAYVDDGPPLPVGTAHVIASHNGEPPNYYDGVNMWYVYWPTPAVGDHTVTAEIIRGDTVRASTTHSFTVTE